MPPERRPSRRRFPSRSSCASGSLLKTHRLPPTHSVEPLSNQSCRLPEFINFCITLYKIFRCERSPYLLDYGENRRIIVLPYMASLVAKKKGNHLYYYVVESARVEIGRAHV